MQDVWDRIGGSASPRGLSAAERRLLAFLRKPRKTPKTPKASKAGKVQVRAQAKA
jgi:DNA topoisomerase-1